MITSFANFLVKKRFYLLAGLSLTGASYLIGKRNKISFTPEGFWKHIHDRFVLNDAFPDIRLSPLALGKFMEEVYFHQYKPKPGDVCVDVGAGIGSESVFMGQAVGKTGAVYAIEASPATFRILEKNIKDNKLSNVKAINIAISNSNQKIRITEISDHHIVNSVLGDTGVEIPATTIDDFFSGNNIDHVNFLKINIEGAEKLLIQGFNKVEIVDRIAVSCHDFLGKRLNDNQYFTKDKINEFLIQHNFNVTTRHTGIDYMDDWIYATNPRLKA